MESLNKDHYYSELLTFAKALLEGEDDEVSAMANLSALIWQTVPDLNWAGFYRVKNEKLVLSPFQGKPACSRIAFGKGVCGNAWAEDRILIVPNVHEFPGHIACDSASNSEIVLPYHSVTGEVLGVLDIDSPLLDRFDEKDKIALGELVRLFEDQLKHNRIV